MATATLPFAPASAVGRDRQWAGPTRQPLATNCFPIPDTRDFLPRAPVAAGATRSPTGSRLVMPLALANWPLDAAKVQGENCCHWRSAVFKKASLFVGKSRIHWYACFFRCNALTPPPAVGIEKASSARAFWRTICRANGLVQRRAIFLFRDVAKAWVKSLRESGAASTLLFFSP